eukprot:6262391-Amphidinium_carterae.1
MESRQIRMGASCQYLTLSPDLSCETPKLPKRSKIRSKIGVLLCLRACATWKQLPDLIVQTKDV